MNLMVTRRVIAIAIAAMMCSAGLQISSAQSPPKREFRAAWIASVASLDWPTDPNAAPDVQQAQLLRILDTLKAAGINAVMFQIRPECDALYQSSYEPWSYWLTGSQGSPPFPFYDPLEFAVEQAHARGMELHAWFNPYRAERVIGLYSLASSHVVVQHPDWILNFPAINQRLLDPGLPQVRDYITAVIMDVVRRYDIDGVHFDDYFYPYPGTGFSGITNEDDATFASYNRGFINRGDWRRDNVNLQMREIKDSIDMVKPYIKFGISPFGIWKNGVPSGIIGLDAYSTLYADPIAWIREGSIDYLTPQLYWKIGGNQDYSKLMPWWSDSTAFYGRHHYPGHIFGSYTTSELPNQVRLNRANAKVGGSVFFRASFFLDHSLGFADTLEHDLYRSISILPIMAWKDTVQPYMPRGIRYDLLQPDGVAALQWDLPNPAPDGDSASRYVVYRFDHSPQASETDDPAAIVSVEGGRHSFLPTPPTTGSPYYYVATALDRNYNESLTSSIVSVSPAPAPLLAYPANNSTDLPQTFPVGWQRLSQASSYNLQISTDSTFASAILVNISNIPDSFYTVSTLEGQATYYWRVLANNAGGTGPYSQISRFATGFPATPILAYPANFMVNVPIDTVVRWNANPSASTYDLQISKYSNFAPNVVDTSGLTDTLFVPGPFDSFTIYNWRVRATNGIGTTAWSPAWRFRTVTVTGVGESGLPGSFALQQNFPNPFNPVTTIEFDLPQATRTTLTVYDILGRTVATLIDDDLQGGHHAVQWNASEYSSGTYFYALRAGSFFQIRKMLVLK